MILYMVRHAIAVSRGTPGIADDDRALTEEGIKKMERAASGLRSMGYIPELILSSPLIRARQTADLLIEAFGKGVQLEIVPALAPSGSRQKLYQDMGLRAKKFGSLMLVGHQPSLGEIAGEIAWGSAEHYVEFKKGGACAIELESVHDIPKGHMISLLTSSILRKIQD
jgi:phosphohistidine phosphatase